MFCKVIGEKFHGISPDDGDILKTPWGRNAKGSDTILDILRHLDTYLQAYNRIRQQLRKINQWNTYQASVYLERGERGLSRDRRNRTQRRRTLAPSRYQQMLDSVLPSLWHWVKWDIAGNGQKKGWHEPVVCNTFCAARVTLELCPGHMTLPAMNSEFRISFFVFLRQPCRSARPASSFTR